MSIIQTETQLIERHISVVTPGTIVPGFEIASVEEGHVRLAVRSDTWRQMTGAEYYTPDDLREIADTLIRAADVLEAGEQ